MNEDQKNNDVVEAATSKYRSVGQATVEVLNEWKGTGNLQFPKLFGMLAMKLNWGEPDIRENDPLVRHFIRNHPDWIISLGSGGGVGRRAEVEKMRAEREAKKTNRKPRKKKAVSVVNSEVMDEIRAEVESRTSSMETRAILTDEDEEEFGGEE